MKLKRLFNETDCIAGSNTADYTGQLLILKHSSLSINMQLPEYQLWVAEDGFGTNPNSLGRAVYATCLSDGEYARWNRDAFLGIADPRKLPRWAKKITKKYFKKRYDKEN